MAVPDERLRAALRALISDAALGARDWLDVAYALRGAFQVDLTSIEIIDRRTGIADVAIADPLDDKAVAEYVTHVVHINPRLAVVDPQLFRVYAEREIPADLAARSGEYYDWIARQRLPRWTAGGVVIDDATHFAVCSMQHSAARGPTEEMSEAAWGAMLPHLANALQIERALALKGHAPDMLAASGRAFAFVRADGTLAEPSDAFVKAIAARAGVSLRKGRLVCAREADRRAVAALLAGAVAGDGRMPRPVRIGRNAGGHGLLLRALPLSAGRELFARLRPAALIALVDLDAPAAAHAADLRAIWGLSPREAELALLLAAGRTLEQASAALGIGEGTARHHLKGVFRRMEIDRQADLVRLVNRVTG